MNNSYKISLCGENVYLKVNDDINRYGFFINIFTVGEDEEVAIKVAKESVMSRLQNNPAVDKNSIDNMKLVVDEIVVIQQETEQIEQGFVWYPDNSLDG